MSSSPNPTPDRIGDAEQEKYCWTVVIPNNAIRVAFLEGQLVGFVAAPGTSISQLYVRKGFHRRGIGSRLLEWSKNQSGGSLVLFTFEQNAAAGAFYERRGFNIVALVRGCMGDPGGPMMPGGGW